MTYALFSIPVPPTTNNLFATVGRRRVQTREYKSWLEAAGWQIKTQRVPKVEGDVKVTLVITRPTVTSDLDNRIKPILDSLVKFGVIDDDTQVCAINAAWGFADGCRVIVETIPRVGVETDNPKRSGGKDGRVLRRDAVDSEDRERVAAVGGPRHVK